MQQIDYQIDDFMIYCQSKGLTKKTMASYEATLRLFARYLEDTCSIGDAVEVKEEMIREHINNTQEREKYTFVSNTKMKRTNCPENRSDYGEKVSKTTINNYIRNIKVFYNYLFEQRLIKINPMKRIKE